MPDASVDYVYPSPAQRIVALGDLHGDLATTKEALRLAEVIDDSGHWTGEKTVLVQVGDQLDRGPDDRAILDFLVRLEEEAGEAGGAVHVLNGNHELLNVMLNFAYVYPEEAFTAFSDIPFNTPDAGIDAGMDAGTSTVPELHRGRAAAFTPGGPYAQILGGHDSIIIVGRTLFVHAGLTPKYVEHGIANVNQETRAWMRGEADMPLLVLDYVDGSHWTRKQGRTITDPECLELAGMLYEMGVRRMVVGHTVQTNINAACDGLVYRIDTGMSKSYLGGNVEVLEIRGNRVRIVQQALSGP
jgi:hypothetical protein